MFNPIIDSRCVIFNYIVYMSLYRFLSSTLVPAHRYAVSFHFISLNARAPVYVYVCESGNSRLVTMSILRSILYTVTDLECTFGLIADFLIHLLSPLVIVSTVFFSVIIAYTTLASVYTCTFRL